MEIERKFLVKEFDRPRFGDRIFQGYLCLGNKEEVRLRRIHIHTDAENNTSSDHQFFLTVKRGTGMVRTEIETGINMYTAYELWPATEGRRIEKWRYERAITAGNKTLTAYVDVYEGEQFIRDGKALTIVEVEFDSEEEANAFKPLEWFGEEVTNDERYKNRALAVDGMP